MQSLVKNNHLNRRKGKVVRNPLSGGGGKNRWGDKPVGE